MIFVIYDEKDKRREEIQQKVLDFAVYEFMRDNRDYL